MLQTIKDMLILDRTEELKLLSDLYNKARQNEFADLENDFGKQIHEKMIIAANANLPLNNHQLSAEAAGWTLHGRVGFLQTQTGEQSNETTWLHLCSEKRIPIKQTDVKSIWEVHPKLGHLLERIYQKTIVLENGNYLWSRINNGDPLDDSAIIAIIWSTFEENKKKEIEMLKGYLFPREAIDRLK